MKMRLIKLVYFSPTGTTKKVIQTIACGIHHENIEVMDITKPEARKRLLQTREDELLIVAVPVYMGRVPSVLSEWLNSIEAHNTPAVCVVVYGNRAYENALLELKDVLIKCGCKPIAGAAYIGEHSFSSKELPSSVGRPDSIDLYHAELFGQKIKEKLKSLSEVERIIDIPGNYPYGGTKELWHIDFISVSSECTQCGLCAEGCPVAAIDPEKSNLIDKDKCTLCCACIKGCPQNARTIKPGLMKDAAIRCHENFKERKEPVFFV
jgi:ferredoxin